MRGLTILFVVIVLVQFLGEVEIGSMINSGKVESVIDGDRISNSGAKRS